MPFDGLRVVSFESRRATEMGELIRRQGGDPFVAPSMRETPIENNPEAFEFAERLFRGEFDLMIFLTGVGTRALNKVLASRYPEEQFAQALRKIAVAARGPKPLAALRELKIPVAVTAPEPNTWRELLVALDGRPERSQLEHDIAVQEYGKPNIELIEGLRARGAEVTPVRVYQWSLPEDLAPLREAVHRISEGKADVAMFTTSIQIPHLFRIATEERLAGEQSNDTMQNALRRMVIASIGPTTSETLEEFGLEPDITPSHPKMGFLVKETAEQATAILQRKRAARA
jgi:uroporphyrinogen-III synthase